MDAYIVMRFNLKGIEMITLDSIKIEDDTTVKVGDIIHVIVEEPWEFNEILTEGKVNSIVSGGSCLDFIEVDVNGVVCKVDQSAAFSTRRALVEHYIKSLLRRLDVKERKITYLRQDIEETEHEMGSILVQVHELKKEIGEV